MRMVLVPSLRWNIQPSKVILDPDLQRFNKELTLLMLPFFISTEATSGKPAPENITVPETINSPFILRINSSLFCTETVSVLNCLGKISAFRLTVSFDCEKVLCETSITNRSNKPFNLFEVFISLVLKSQYNIGEMKLSTYRFS